LKERKKESEERKRFQFSSLSFCFVFLECMYLSVESTGCIPTNYYVLTTFHTYINIHSHTSYTCMPTHTLCLMIFTQTQTTCNFSYILSFLSLTLIHSPTLSCSVCSPLCSLLLFTRSTSLTHSLSQQWPETGTHAEEERAQTPDRVGFSCPGFRCDAEPLAARAPPHLAQSPL
jgi:hypothetical protein